MNAVNTHSVNTVPFCFILFTHTVNYRGGQASLPTGSDAEQAPAPVAVFEAGIKCLTPLSTTPKPAIIRGSAPTPTGQPEVIVSRVNRAVCPVEIFPGRYRVVSPSRSHHIHPTSSRIATSPTTSRRPNFLPRSPSLPVPPITQYIPASWQQWLVSSRILRFMRTLKMRGPSSNRSPHCGRLRTRSRAMCRGKRNGWNVAY